MVGRITQNMVSRSVLRDLNLADARLTNTQRKLSSGKEITRPSDDPFATARALDLRGELEGARQHSRNVDDGLAWADVTDAAMRNISDATIRVRELLVAGATDSAGPTARAAMAKEIEGLIASIKQEGNASFAGRYIFAGTATLTQPFDVDGADAYAGNGDPIAREIGPGVSVAVNVDGAELLGSGPGGTGLLGALRGIVAHLTGGTTADADALRGADLRALDAAGDQLSRLQAGIGTTANRLQSAGARLAELQESSARLLSETEDADMAKTMVDFSMQQSVYQAALRSGANIVQASLLDFLR